MQEIQFDYFHGMEAEQYTFYRIPKILFTAECFKTISCEAKVLYGLLLDRMSLSIKNRWFDEEDRVYIIFTVEEIAELMNCGTQKAVRLLKELDSERGKPKNCTVCGVEYVPSSGISKYCPACAKRIQREKSNESKRRSRERNRRACIELSAKNDRLIWNSRRDVSFVRVTRMRR